MSFPADVIADQAGVFTVAEGAAAAYYNTATEAIYILEEAMNPTLQAAGVGASSKVVWVQASDVASPIKGDTFTISGATWYLARILSAHTGINYQLELTRQTRRQL